LTYLFEDHFAPQCHWNPRPMLSIIEWGSPSPFKRTFEMIVMQKYLEQLSVNVLHLFSIQGTRGRR
jgi:hypothetical protein